MEHSGSGFWSKPKICSCQGGKHRAKWVSANLCQTGKYVPQRRGNLSPIPPSQESGNVASPFRTYHFSRVINLYFFYLKHPHFKILQLIISKYSESQTIQLLSQRQPEHSQLTTSDNSDGSHFKTRYNVLVLKHPNTSAIQKLSV